MTSVNPAKQRESTEQKITSHNLGTPGVLEHPGVVRSICRPSKPAMMYDVNSGISSHFGKVQKGVYTQQVQVDQPLPIGRIGNPLHVVWSSTSRGIHILYLHNCIHVCSIYIAKIQ